MIIIVNIKTRIEQIAERSMGGLEKTIEEGKKRHFERIRELSILSSYAHGTNGKQLEGILIDGKVLPGDEIRKRGRLIYTGESAGLTPLNKNYVSVISLSQFSSSLKVKGNEDIRIYSGYMYEAIAYAYKAARGAITPSNINENASYYQNLIDKHANPSDKSIQEGVQMFKIVLEDLNKMKLIFGKMSEKDKVYFEKVSKIPVVVIGEGEKSPITYKVYTAIEGETEVKELKISRLAVPTKDFDLVEGMLKVSKCRYPIVPLENLREWHDSLLTEREAIRCGKIRAYQRDLNL